MRFSVVALALCPSGCLSQLLPPGTVDVPIQRPGDCGGEGPATYVNHMVDRQANDFFPAVCPDLGGAEVHFNNPCDWAHGQAQMTYAHFTKMCKGATRTIHWHSQADEWGYVNKGMVEAFVASPDGLPWPSSYNLLKPRGVWYFPAGYLHGLMCVTPEEEGGCDFTIVFASPQSAEPNGHNLDTTMAQAPNVVGAQALNAEVASFASSRHAFARAAHSVHYSNSNMTAPIVTPVLPGVCDPVCPKREETHAAPAGVQADAVEQRVLLPGVEGVVLHRIRTAQFPFARTMSQERTELAPGATRPMVWVSAEATLVVVAGSIDFGLEGGIPGAESHEAFTNNTLLAGDIAYIPNGRAFWFTEATGTSEAETITVFNVGNWKSFEASQSVAQMPETNVISNLRLTHPLMPASYVEVEGLTNPLGTSVLYWFPLCLFLSGFAVVMAVACATVRQASLSHPHREPLLV